MTLENRGLIGNETYELMMWYSALYNDLIGFMTVLSNKSNGRGLSLILKIHSILLTTIG